MPGNETARHLAHRKRPVDDPVVPATLRAGLKQFTRERLLEAGRHFFQTNGYHETTLEQIVKMAGTTVPTFYRHFANKQDLLRPLLNHLSTDIANTLRELDAIDARERQNVRQWLDSYMRMWLRLHELCRAYWETANVDQGYAEKLMEDLMGCVALMERTVARIPQDQRAGFGTRLGLLILFLDRLALATSLADKASDAKQLLDEFGKLLWLVVNDDPALKG